MQTKLIISCVAIASLGLAFAYRSTANSNSAPVSSIQTVAGKGEAAPGFELKDLEGKAVKLSDFKGKVVLLNFWATWCPPCREEIPDLVALQTKYEKQGLVVLGVSLDEKGPAPVKAFAKRMKVNYPVIMGDEKTVAAYGNFQAIPTTFYIDRAGRIAGMHEGGADEAMFEAAVKPLLEGPGA